MTRRLAVCLLAGLAASSVFAAQELPHFIASRHFSVQYESPYPPAGVLNTLEGLHAKLLLDLLPFAPWAKDGKIQVVLYSSAERYRAVEVMPAWAGGHVDVKARRIFLFEGDEFRRTMAHEMAHLFVQDYFAARGSVPPDWLNEGVAMRMEGDYGGAVSSGGRELKEASPSLEAFFNLNYRHAAQRPEEVALWYGQAGSLAGYLMRQFPRGQFVAFCDRLRNGASVTLEP
ncbi:MAG TPA: hypothetical protein P5079_01560, partial [Elusimicrobiota bacterium]|nr:hypothetical protein [Elusimicrobiota bacterium]